MDASHPLMVEGGRVELDLRGRRHLQCEMGGANSSQANRGGAEMKANKAIVGVETAKRVMATVSPRASAANIASSLVTGSSPAMRITISDPFIRSPRSRLAPEPQDRYHRKFFARARARAVASADPSWNEPCHWSQGTSAVPRLQLKWRWWS